MHLSRYGWADNGSFSKHKQFKQLVKICGGNLYVSFGGLAQDKRVSSILFKCSQSKLCINAVTSTQIRFAFSFTTIHILCARQRARRLVSVFFVSVCVFINGRKKPPCVFSKLSENNRVFFVLFFFNLLLWFFLVWPHFYRVLPSEHSGLRSCFDYQINQCVVLRRERLDMHGRPLDTTNAQHCSVLGAFHALLQSPEDSGLVPQLKSFCWNWTFFRNSD